MSSKFVDTLPRRDSVVVAGVTVVCAIGPPQLLLRAAVIRDQVGGGNGKKLATVAGVLLGGYAGNEVAHDRNPLPFSGR